MSCNSLARGNRPLSTLSSRLLWRYYPICYSNPSIAQRHLGSPTRQSWRNQYPQGAHITSQQTSNSSWFQRLSAESLISIDAEVAEGVQYLHSEGIVHGDLRGVRIVIAFCLLIHTVFHLGKYPSRLWIPLPNLWYRISMATTPQMLSIWLPRV